MAVDSVDNRPTVADNTRIIPEYIPPNLKWATNSPNNSMLFWEIIQILFIVLNSIT